jgi:hypothetical protein
MLIIAIAKNTQNIPKSKADTLSLSLAAISLLQTALFELMLNPHNFND